jgi:hypothetical protein
MNDGPVAGTTNVVNGHLLRLGDGREVAIYRRNGQCWVAEFHDGCGRLFDATWWFRFHVGSLRYSHGNRAAALDSATAITPELLAQIEQLHRRADHAASPALITAVVNAVRRGFGLGASKVRRSASRRAQQVD